MDGWLGGGIDIYSRWMDGWRDRYIDGWMGGGIDIYS